MRRAAGRSSSGRPDAGPPSNLPGALRAHARAAAADPWLFFAAGLHWRWRSFGELERWVARWAAALARREAGTRLAFAYGPSPEGIALDLAAQAAGLTAAPGRPGAAPDAAALELPPEGGRSAASSGFSLPDDRETGDPERGDRRPGQSDRQSGSSDRQPEDRQPGGRQLGGRQPGGRQPGDPERGRQPGGVVVETAGGPVELGQPELVAGAARFQALVAAAAPPRRGSGREIVVSAGSLADPAERALLAWATVAGAAVVLEPEPVSLVATAAWVRPTLFQGTPAELAALRAQVEKRGRSSGAPEHPWQFFGAPATSRRLAGSPHAHRLPFGRLRLLLVRGGEPLAPGDAAFWEERGVRLLVPAPLPPRVV